MTFLQIIGQILYYFSLIGCAAFWIVFIYALVQNRTSYWRHFQEGDDFLPGSSIPKKFQD